MTRSETRGRIAPLLARLMLAAALLPAPALAVGAGEAAPGFVLPGRDGSVSLEALRGKVVYLDFWASWCGPCRRSFPWMGAMQERYGAQGLQVVAINLDAKREDAERFLAATPAGFMVAFDPAGQQGRAYAVKGMPSSVLVGRDGRVLWRHAGFRDEDREELEKRIAAALAPGDQGASGR